MTTTYARSINQALRDGLKSDSTVILMGEDICDPYGGPFKITLGLSSEFPGRVINTPLSEPALVGVATGMALRGMRPVLEIMFGDFLALGADQIINHLAKFKWMYNDQVETPVVIRTPVGGRRGYGPTHSQCLERLFFGLPCLKILAPSHIHDVGDALVKAIDDPDPIIFIEHKILYPRKLELPQGDYWKDWAVRSDSELYETLIVATNDFKTSDVTIVVYGGMLPLVEEAVQAILALEKIGFEMVVPLCIKPLGLEPIFHSVRRTGRLIIVEEGTMAWGWGAELAAQAVDKEFLSLEAPIRRVSALDVPIPSAKPLEEHVLPSSRDIERAILEVLE